jgi:hypothetical protein
VTITPSGFVIWSIEHGAWWRPGEVGYCDTLAEAGLYTEAEAARIVARANIVHFHECIIPVAAVNAHAHCECRRCLHLDIRHAGGACSVPGCRCGGWE